MKVLVKILRNHVNIVSLNLLSFCAGLVNVSYSSALNVQLLWLRYSRAINRESLASPAVGNDCSRCCPLLEIYTLLVPKYFLKKKKDFLIVCSSFIKCQLGWSAGILLKSEIFIKTKETKAERCFWFISVQPLCKVYFMCSFKKW